MTLHRALIGFFIRLVLPQDETIHRRDRNDDMNWITYGPSGHPISNMQGTPEKPSDIR